MRNRRGAALFITLLVVSVMLILGGVAISIGINESALAQGFIRDTQAFWLAEAGIQKASRTLNDGSWNSTEWTAVLPQGYTTTANLGAGSYTVALTCTNCSNPIATSTGTVGNKQRTIVGRFQSESLLGYAAIADNKLTMSGNGKTDSYDSTKGAYGAGNKSNQGDIGSNGTYSGAVTLSGYATVNGDASTGPGGSVVKSGNAKVNGTTTSANDIDLPEVEVPDCLTGISESEPYSVGGNTNTTIGTGNYRFPSFAISGNGKVTITGTVKIYVTDASALNISGNGKIVISGNGNLLIYSDGVCNISGNGIANNTAIPANFILRSTYTGANGINISGNADLQGVVYAPKTDITNTGNGDIYGTAIGKNITISGNGSIHYDQALGNALGLSSFTLQNWSDENTPYPL